MTTPLIVRLQGTKETEAKKLIQESGMKIFSYDGLDEGKPPPYQRFGFQLLQSS